MAGVRLYRAICEWFESMTVLNLVQAAAIDDSGPSPEGAGPAHVEHAHSYTSEPEMHAGWRPDPTEDWDDRKSIGFAANR